MNFSDEDIKQLLHHADREKHDLISRCQRGDRAAFTQFTQDYEHVVFAHVYRIVGDKTAAADITRDIFVEAYQSFPQFRGEVSEKVWLFRIAEKHLQLLHPEPPRPSPEPEATTAEETDKRLLIAYLDGELSDSEAESVEQRLAEDMDYRRMYENIQATEDILRYYTQRSAPANLLAQVYAKIDQKPFGERVRVHLQQLVHEINKAIITVKKKWSEPSFTPIFRPVAVIISLVLVFSLVLNVYQYRNQQVQQLHIRNLEKQRDMIVRSRDASQQPLQNTFIILTGKLDPHQISLAETRQLARVISEFAGEQEPLFIPGDTEKIVGFIAERMIALYWNTRQEQTLSKDHLTIRRISVEMPVNANVSFSQALRQLSQKPDAQILSTDTTMIPIDIYIIDRQ
jgi:DNA-directed RNA polymerase specialized sigma24 family protein